MLRIIYNGCCRHTSAELFERGKLTTINNYYNHRLYIFYQQEIGQNFQFLSKLAPLKNKVSVCSTFTTERWDVPTCKTIHDMHRLRHTLPVLLNNLVKKNITIEHTSLKYICAWTQLMFNADSTRTIAVIYSTNSTNNAVHIKD